MEKQNSSDLGNQSPDKIPRVYHVNVLLVNNLVFRITKSMHIARLCLAKCLLGLPLNGFAKPQHDLVLLTGFHLSPIRSK